jgi:integrase/recombinase XerD
MHFRIKGKRNKIRFVPAHVTSQRLIGEYLAVARHGDDAAGPLFRPVKKQRHRRTRPPAQPQLGLP